MIVALGQPGAELVTVAVRNGVTKAPTITATMKLSQDTHDVQTGSWRALFKVHALDTSLFSS